MKVANFFRRNAGSEGAAEGGFKGGIPPRPSVPPERSGGGQFFSKKVRAFSNKGHKIGLRDFLRGEAEVRPALPAGRSPRLRARLAFLSVSSEKFDKSFSGARFLKLREPSLSEKSATFLKLIVSKFLKNANDAMPPPDRPKTKPIFSEIAQRLS